MDLRDSNKNKKEKKMEMFFSLFILFFVLKCIVTHGYKTRSVIKMGTNNHMKSIITSITSGFVVNGIAVNGANALDIDNKMVNNMVIHKKYTTLMLFIDLCLLTPLFIYSY